MEPATKRSKPNVDEEDNKDAVKMVACDEREIEALVNKRRLEVLKLTKELQEAQKRLSDAEVILSQIQHKHKATIQDALITDHDKSKDKIEGNFKSLQSEQDSYGKEWQSKPKLVVPTAITKEESIRSTDITKIRSTPGGIKLISRDRQFESSGIKSKSRGYISAPEVELVNLSDNENSEEQIPKRKSDERRECVDLISEVCSSKSASTMQFFHPSYVSSQHKRKLRSLVINPSIGHLCATSALDGAINFWKILENGLSLKLLSTIESVSPGQRRWPEDITWHPDGEKLFAAYSADGGDHQVSIINMHGAEKVTFLEEKPHIKGIVNSIVFMPWDSVCFATGGCDHTVVLWNEREKDGGWEPKSLHRNFHTSAVTGIAGMRQKQMVLSVGQDKRIIGYDVPSEKTDLKLMLESKAMGLLLNPVDLNLFMVQTGTPGRQLRLFDIRVHGKEIHKFGWTQETSDSQSALIHQTWSPDGLYISTGSADPNIHVFDIRYDSQEPFQSIKAHQRRVFKAAWHSTLPLLISISSDLQIGLHQISK